MDAEAWRSGVAGEVKALFGKPVRVLLAAWIMDQSDMTFYLQDVQRELSSFAAHSAVATELRVFVKYEMLSEATDGQRVTFTRLLHPLWDAYDRISGAFSVRPVG